MVGLGIIFRTTMQEAVCTDGVKMELPGSVMNSSIFVLL
jgi:hypothetical protein